MQVKSIAISEIGHVRTHNEDAVFADDELGLWLVADGMGGHAAGEVASQLAVDSIVGDIEADELLASAVQRAHLAIKAAAKENPQQAGMGTTVVAVQKRRNAFNLVWSGDSRIYAVDGNGELRQLTVDHSFVGDMVARGVLTEEEAHTHPKKNLINQALGMSNITHLRPGEATFRPKGTGLLLLCSDGVSDMLDVASMAGLFRGDTSLASRADVLKSAVRNTAASDNFSFVLVEYSPRGLVSLLRKLR